MLDEALPQRLRRAARPPVPWVARRLVAGLAIALAGGAAGWGLRGAADGAPDGGLTLSESDPPGFAARAAVAHAVYSVDARRAVELDAAHEEQLVAWLSKRLAAPVRPPRLQALGYALEGGRLLPGGRGPVAQFMYRDAAGRRRRLTLYVSNELGHSGGAGARGEPNGETAFRFAREGGVDVFYWVDGPFGYALSGEAGRDALARAGGEVYRQLGGR